MTEVTRPAGWTPDRFKTILEAALAQIGQIGSDVTVWIEGLEEEGWLLHVGEQGVTLMEAIWQEDRRHLGGKISERVKGWSVNTYRYDPGYFNHKAGEGLPPSVEDTDYTYHENPWNAMQDVIDRVIHAKVTPVFERFMTEEETGG
jgi:hypothetical protein